DARTVKSRGPDIPKLISTHVEALGFAWGWWPTSPAHQGEREAAVKTSRAGRAGSYRLNLWYLPPAFFFAGGPQASAEAWPSLRPLFEEGGRK
ncbi:MULTISPECIES: hypothetical protein, partial [unclassified Bradyrhizobium]|uniref:hypothetical protein n=1 Tax=unclassified Bradyrhizobium TaxID=2631580 RepID=UPI0024E06120